MSKEKPSDFFTSVSAKKSSLAYALALQEACAKVGFDWSNPMPVLDKVKEEIDEIETELCRENRQQAWLEEEIGDAFFALINLARHCNVDAERALLAASEKFKSRFTLVVQYVHENGKAIEAHSLVELEQLWLRAKQAGKDV